ncbi:MAG TPA: serine/threonine protein kinase [Candidatus Corynebacterium faecigallinarum]|uniref:non-specific serine/threonine protein kinase n=1 Tax=Candidatus Corynebacterium faecigallinarum TaxID=2838528 RepID=A0A9D2TPE9_9CORY|nr:serine/threonine protein kinase [Candidatus Corynebacterium faecigallinarum]
MPDSTPFSGNSGHSVNTNNANPERPGTDQRWSIWPDIIPTWRGPRPHPDWLVTDAAAFDTEFGTVKSGKEATVDLIERAVPGQPGCLLAAKRFLGAEHSDFHRSSTYTEGRRVRDSREARAMKNKTAFGRDVAAGHWVTAEFDALCSAWDAGLPVPYPVQVDGTEILMEFIGDGYIAAPRLAQSRPSGAALDDAFDQVVAILEGFVRMGCVHGDLSPYNLLEHHGRIVVIDLPQMLDAAANPRSLDFLHRDVVNVTSWFTRRGKEMDPRGTLRRAHRADVVAA